MKNNSCLLFISIIAGSFLVFLVACSRQPVYPPPSMDGTDVVVDIAALRPGIPRFFTYTQGGKNISFFVLKLNEQVLSFFDACASCYPQKRGYRYEDGSVVCGACGMKFPVYRLGKGLGGCYPIKLEGKTMNGKYLIPLARFEKAADKF